jgi:hypothetical protein
MNALARPRLRRWQIVLLLTTTVLVGVAALSCRRTSKAEISLLRQTGGWKNGCSRRTRSLDREQPIAQAPVASRLAARVI